MPEQKFAFPNDDGKAPLISVTTSRTEKDYIEIVQGLSFKSGFSKAAYISAVCIMISFFGFLTLAAIMTGFWVAAIFWGILTTFVVYSMGAFKRAAKKTANQVPNNSSFYTYTFFKHHLDFASEYNAAAIDYDLFTRGYENSLGFLLVTNLNAAHYIPKAEISMDETAMLRNVLINKLGSKFIVKAI